jgi:hypothetical protein
LAFAFFGIVIVIETDPDPDLDNDPDFQWLLTCYNLAFSGFKVNGTLERSGDFVPRWIVGT